MFKKTNIGLCLAISSCFAINPTFAAWISVDKDQTYDSDQTLSSVKATNNDVTIVAKKNLTFNKEQPFNVDNHTVNVKVDGDLNFVGGSSTYNKIRNNAIINLTANTINIKDLDGDLFRPSDEKGVSGATINLTANQISQSGENAIFNAYGSKGVNINLTGNIQIINQDGESFRLDNYENDQTTPSSLTITYAGDSNLKAMPVVEGTQDAIIRAGHTTTVKIQPIDENASLHLQGGIDFYEETPEVFVNLGKKGSWVGGSLSKVSHVNLDLGDDGSLFVLDNVMGKILITGGKGTITSTSSDSVGATCVVDMQNKAGIDIVLQPRNIPFNPEYMDHLSVFSYTNVPDDANISIDLSKWGEVKEHDDVRLAYFEENIANLLDGKIIADQKKKYTHFYEDLTTVQKTNEKNQKYPNLSLLVVSLEKHKATPLIDYSAQFGKEALSSLLISNSQIPFSLEHGTGFWVDHGYHTYKYDGIKSQQNNFGIGYSKDVKLQETVHQIGFGIHFNKSKDRKLQSIRSNDYFVSIYDDLTFKDRHHVNLMTYGGLLRRSADNVGHFNNKAFGLTARYGYDLYATPDMVITPAVGLYYQHVDRTKFQRNTVSYEIGAKDLFVTSLEAEIKWLGSSTFKPYANVTYYLPNSQSADIRFTDGVTTLKSSSDKINSWGRIKIGGTYQVTHNLSLAGDLGTDFGKKRSKAFNSNLTLNYAF